MEVFLLLLKNYKLGDSAIKQRYEQYLFQLEIRLTEYNNYREKTQIKAYGYDLSFEFVSSIVRDILIPRGMEVTIYTSCFRK